MKKTGTYKSVTEALEALDNGGRFYNLFTSGDDEVISLAEVGKVAGIIVDHQKSILFLDLSISDLGQKEADVVLGKMDSSLQSAWQKYKSGKFTPSEAISGAGINSNAIITGIPRLTDARSALSGFVLISILVNKVPVMMPVPITDEYDIYEIRDEAGSDAFLIAHSRSDEKLPEKAIKAAGLIKELFTEEGETDPSKKFLEVLYYSEV